MSPTSPTNDIALQERVAPILLLLDERRQSHLKICRSAAMWCAASGIAACLLALGATAQAGQSSPWSFLAPLIALGVYWVIVSLEKSKYGSNFKKLLMPPLVAQFGQLSFEADAGLSEDEFNLANLHARPDRFSAQDLIEGKIGATAVRLSEVEAETRTERRDEKGRVTTTYTTFFQGLFLIADFNKNLGGTTVVLPEGVTGSLGNFGAKLQSMGGTLSGRGELVKLEDPEFEAHFKAFSTDQIEARYVLSSSLMRRFLDLRNEFGCDISAAFQGESLYLTIDTRRNWFEAPPLGTPLDFAALCETLTQLESAMGVVETLDLNTRIWHERISESTNKESPQQATGYLNEGV